MTIVEKELIRLYNETLITLEKISKIIGNQEINVQK